MKAALQVARQQGAAGYNCYMYGVRPSCARRLVRRIRIALLCEPALTSWAEVT